MCIIITISLLPLISVIEYLECGEITNEYFKMCLFPFRCRSLVHMTKQAVQLLLLRLLLLLSPQNCELAFYVVDAVKMLK